MNTKSYEMAINALLGTIEDICSMTMKGADNYDKACAFCEFGDLEICPGEFNIKDHADENNITQSCFVLSDKFKEPFLNPESNEDIVKMALDAFGTT